MPFIIRTSTRVFVLALFFFKKDLFINNIDETPLDFYNEYEDKFYKFFIQKTYIAESQRKGKINIF